MSRIFILFTLIMLLEACEDPAPLSDAYGKLKEGDIILSIDGHSISNDGKCQIPGIGNRIDLNYLFTLKNIL